MLTDCGQDVPYFCVSENSAPVTVSIGAGRRFALYNTPLRRIVWETRTNYPVLNALSAPTSCDVFVVTEISVSRVSNAGETIWEYWSPEPIEDAWMDGGTVRYLDIEGKVTSVSVDAGSVVMDKA
jgi:hypothetical protein